MLIEKYKKGILYLIVLQILNLFICFKFKSKVKQNLLINTKIKLFIKLRKMGCKNSKQQKNHKEINYTETKNEGKQEDYCQSHQELIKISNIKSFSSLTDCSNPDQITLLDLKPTQNNQGNLIIQALQNFTNLNSLILDFRQQDFIYLIQCNLYKSRQRVYLNSIFIKQIQKEQLNKNKIPLQIIKHYFLERLFNFTLDQQEFKDLFQALKNVACIQKLDLNLWMSKINNSLLTELAFSLQAQSNILFLSLNLIENDKIKQEEMEILYQGIADCKNLTFLKLVTPVSANTNKSLSDLGNLILNHLIKLKELYLTLKCCQDVQNLIKLLSKTKSITFIYFNLWNLNNIKEFDTYKYQLCKSRRLSNIKILL
ncbi:hypothetical protein TTHERM_00171620 (macronuclear) [Tetrahymena thermophila SB210]|uniref:Uncharacterized protein n=1 Tax=Tetrahymena thermophila (strain SB210) TaxID=312017 RepID=Q22TG3_TETTS|nr:hypothetical protein TTHERM_00171620 [Tetrahymena thermophila SB210]EAR88475.2 hypothetical protein TTHERM_00171620 [Tetrahymena thermophila SB210]|eukprot:XP_001008720.2 hypothetical protein TTHERM_00171620 [Tetrahymena thermophila SB210]